MYSLPSQKGSCLPKFFFFITVFLVLSFVHGETSISSHYEAPGSPVIIPVAPPTPEDKLNAILCDRLDLYNTEIAESLENPANPSKKDLIKQWLGLIYENIGMHPLWVTVDGPGEKAEILLSILENAAVDGLNPADYFVDHLQSLWPSRTPDDVIELDTLLTLAFIDYARDTQNGRVQSLKIRPELRTAEQEQAAFDPLTTLHNVLQAPDFTQAMTDLLPRHQRYTSLRAALPFYQKLAENGGWPQLASGTSIRPGEQNPRIPALRKRLQIEGFLPVHDSDTTLYDPELIKAVSQLQLQHGLGADGVIGKSTIAAMNISADAKVKQILINLERWRWQAHDFEEHYALVDITGFTLEIIDKGKIILEMPVVVGTPQHETPTFSDHIQYVELNPYWNIPTQIARDEILVELHKNPNYLNAKHIRLFSDRSSEATELSPLSMNWQQISPQTMGRFKLRQDPGKWNALGAIKIAFPNSYNIYMHDTPSQNLFKRSSRSFSHGCIRLSDPLLLATLLLTDSEKWPKERLQEIIATGKRTIINLAAPLPLHIIYQTVKCDANGTVFFYSDIYNRDQPLIEAFFTKK